MESAWSKLGTIKSSKGVGEPPLFLGATVFFAIRMAIASARRDNGLDDGFVFDSPATCERIRLAVGDEIVRDTKVVKGEGEVAFWSTAV